MNDPLTIKPEVWMPFIGQDFDRSTKGWTRADKWSYWAALWAYWLGQCAGIPNDELIMRGVCECEMENWARVKGLIFGPKFKLVNGAWHNRRNRLEYDRATIALEASKNRGRAGAAARWGKDTETMPEQCSSNAQAMPEQSLTHAPSPSPSPITNQPEHTPSVPPPATIVCVSDLQKTASELARAKRPDTGWDIQTFKRCLNELYGRPEGDPWMYDEECVLAEIFRRPNSQQEFAAIGSLKAKTEPRYWPALGSLLRNWTSKLDQARTTGKGHTGPTQSEVRAYIDDKNPGGEENANWACSFHRYWQQRQWSKGGKGIDWKVVLSEQISKWRKPTP